MSNEAFVGNIFLWRGDGGSPEAFTQVCQNFGISGLGQTNEQVDSTTFCSGGVKEYIAGLADGSEMTLELNFETVTPGVALITSMIDDVKNKATRNLEIRCGGDRDAPSDIKLIFHLTVTCLSWVLTPSVSAKNAIAFGVKITGDIEIETL